MIKSTISQKVLVSLALLLFLFLREGLAAPTYGTDMPDKRKISIGYTNNTIFKHDLNDSYGNIKSNQCFFDISYGVCDGFSLEGKIGMGDILQKGGIHPKVDYNYGLAGGYGFRFKILDELKYIPKSVLGFHHISVHPQSRNIASDKYEAILDDWQFSFVCSKRFGLLNPFAGVKLSRGDLITKVNEIDKKRKLPSYYAGLLLGCSVKIHDQFSMIVESHFIDESSLSAGCYYTF